MLLPVLVGATTPAATVLPNPLFEGYQINPVDPTIRSEMESGPARVRRTYTARNDKVEVSWVLSESDMAQFRDWFDNEEGANGGAKWFFTNLHMGGGSVQNVEARFASIWKAAPYNYTKWKVSATLEVRYA